MTFFAPCAYPLFPGYVSYYLGTNSMRPQSAAARGDTSLAVGTGVGQRLLDMAVVGLLVSLGFVLVYGVLASIVLTWGRTSCAGSAFWNW